MTVAVPHGSRLEGLISTRDLAADLDVSVRVVDYWARRFGLDEVGSGYTRYFEPEEERLIREAVDATARYRREIERLFERSPGRVLPAVASRNWSRLR